MQCCFNMHNIQYAIYEVKCPPLICTDSEPFSVPYLIFIPTVSHSSFVIQPSSGATLWAPVIKLLKKKTTKETGKLKTFFPHCTTKLFI